MGLYESRSASPMLIAQQMEAFDDPGWIYELKMTVSAALLILMEIL